MGGHSLADDSGLLSIKIESRTWDSNVGLGRGMEAEPDGRAEENIHGRDV